MIHLLDIPSMQGILRQCAAPAGCPNVAMFGGFYCEHCQQKPSQSKPDPDTLPVVSP